MFEVMIAQSALANLKHMCDQTIRLGLSSPRECGRARILSNLQTAFTHSIPTMHFGSEKHNSNVSGPSTQTHLSGADFDLIRENLESLIALAKVQKGTGNIEGIKLIVGSHGDSEMRKAFVTLRDMAKLIELARQHPPPRLKSKEEQVEEIKLAVFYVIVAVVLFG